MRNRLKINRNKRWLWIGVVALLAFGCKKDAVPEIAGIQKVEPLPYFPVYPGSHWTYLDSNGDTKRIETGPDYALDKIVHASAASEEKALVPMYDGIPIWGYRAHPGGPNQPFQAWMSEEIPVGGAWIVQSHQGSSISRRIAGKDETVIVAGNTYYPVIIVEEYNPQAPAWAQLRERFYFAKNVGIVKIERNDPVNNTEVITTSELIEYKINH